MRLSSLWILYSGPHVLTYVPAHPQWDVWVKLDEYPHAQLRTFPTKLAAHLYARDRWPTRQDHWAMRLVDLFR